MENNSKENHFNIILKSVSKLSAFFMFDHSIVPSIYKLLKKKNAWKTLGHAHKKARLLILLDNAGNSEVKIIYYSSNIFLI